MGRDSLTGLVVNRKDDASIKRNDRPQLVRYECDGVVQIQRRANSLRDLMQRKHFALGFCNRSETRAMVWCSQRVGRQPRVRTSRRLVVKLLGRYLFLNVLGANELVKLFHVLNEGRDDARTKGGAGQIPEKTN